MFEILRVFGLVIAVLVQSSLSAHSTYDERIIRDHPLHSKYVGCYYQNKVIYRHAGGILKIDRDMKPVHKYCTHLIYAFAEIGDYNAHYQIKMSDAFADVSETNGHNGYKEFTNLRFLYPRLKTTLSLGGPDQNSAQRFSEMAKSRDYRNRFIIGVVDFLKNHNFEGLDLWWEYPPNKYGAIYDKDNMILLLKELRASFRAHNFILTATVVPNAADILDPIEPFYDVRKISEIVDYLHVKTYDYHGSNKYVINPNSGLDRVSETLDLLLGKHSVSPKKLIIGLPFYARGFYLLDPLRSPTEDRIGKLARVDSWPGSYNNEPGIFLYSEVCKYLKYNARTEEKEMALERWTERWDNLSYTPYAISNDKVLVYENAKSLQAKVQLAMSRGLGGVYVWTTDFDDFHGECNPRYNQQRNEQRTEQRHREDQYDRDDPKFPLLKAVGEALDRSDGTARASALGVLTLTFALAASLHFL